MAKLLPRLYWDTSCWLSFVNADSEPERHAICSHLLTKAKEGEIVLCTSMFSIVEVIRPKGIPFPTPLTDAEVKKLEGMFKWPFIKKYQVDEHLAFKAARLSREQGLKPPDAIHAATAIATGCDALQRWDRDFNKVASLITVEYPKYLTETPLLDTMEAE